MYYNNVRKYTVKNYELHTIPRGRKNNSRSLESLKNNYDANLKHNLQEQRFLLMPLIFGNVYCVLMRFSKLKYKFSHS